MAKIHVDKKRYQAACRKQVLKGLINNAAGLWVAPERSLAGTSVDVFAGYHLRGSKKKTKAAVVEGEE